MDLNQLLNALRATLSPDAATRTAAEQALQQGTSTPGYLPGLIRIISEAQVEAPVRQAATIYFKNIVARHWDGTDGKPVFSEEDKALIRNNMLEALSFADSVLHVQIAITLKTIARLDFPSKWPNLVDDIAGRLTSGDSRRTFGALSALLYLCKNYEYRPSDDRDELQAICEKTFPVLLQLLSSLVNTDTTESYAAQKIIIKTFWVCTQLTVPPMLQQHGAIAPWMEMFMQVLSRRTADDSVFPADPDQRRNHPFWKAKKWVAHIMQRFFSRFGNTRMARSDEEREFAKLFQKEYAVQFLNCILDVLAHRFRHGRYVSDRLVQISLNYIDTALSLAQTYRAVKPHLHMLIIEVIFPLMCFNDEDAELWETDPHEYVRKSFDVIEDFYSPKTAAANVLLSLVKKRPRDTLRPFLDFASDMLAKYAAAPPAERNYRAKDGVLMAIGTLEEKLASSKKYASAIEPLIQQHVIPEFQSEHGFLRARACWVVAEFASMEFNDPSVITNAAEGIVIALRDSDLPVRIQGALGVTRILENESATESLRKHVPFLLEALLDLMHEIDSEELVSTLEGIISHFDDEVAPHALALTQKLTAYLVHALEAARDGDEEESALAALATLRSLATVLASVHDLPQVYREIEPILVPVLGSMLEHQETLDYFEDVLDLITYLTFYGGRAGISAQLWSLFPLMCRAFLDYAPDYMANILAPLDNFIHYAPHVFASSTEPNYRDMVFAIVHRVLTAEGGSEVDAQDACKLAESVIVNARGHIDSELPRYLELGLRRRDHTKNRGSRILLANFALAALATSAPAALAALENAGLAKAALEAAFDNAERATRLHDRRLFILATAQLLSLPLAQLPAAVREALPRLLAKAAYLVQVTAEQRQAADEEEEEDDEDVEGGSEDEDEDEDGLGDDEDEDLSEEAAYLEALAQQSHLLLGDDGDEEDVELEEDEEFTSPLDDIHELVALARAVSASESSDPAAFQQLMQMLPAEAQAALGNAVQSAPHVESAFQQEREKAKASVRLSHEHLSAHGGRDDTGM